MASIESGIEVESALLLLIWDICCIQWFIHHRERHVQQLSHLGLGGPFPLEDADLPVNDSKCLGFQTTHYRHDYGATKALRRSYYCQAPFDTCHRLFGRPIFLNRVQG